MQIVKTGRFLNELETVLVFIARGSFAEAKKFSDNLSEMIFSLPAMPFKCRQSLKSEDTNVRDLIYNHPMSNCTITVRHGMVIYGLCYTI